MSKDKRSERIHDALNLIDDDLIEEVDQLRSNKPKQKHKKVHWYRLATLAACLCVLLVGTWTWNHYLEESIIDEGPQNSPNYDEDGYNGVQGTQRPSNDSIKPDEPSEEFSQPEWELETENMQSTEECDKEMEENKDTVVGDLFDLQDNYVRVSMLPHKIWEEAASKEEALSQAVDIDVDYRKAFDGLVENMCNAHYKVTEEGIEPTPEQVWHLFFERSDGKLVHCWFIELYGYLIYDEEPEYWLILDDAVHEEITKILAMHW